MVPYVAACRKHFSRIMQPDQDTLRGCPTFVSGLQVVADQQVSTAMALDPNVLQAQIAAARLIECIEQY